MMESLHQMISPYKIYPDKNTPTINVLDPTSAYAWFKMRKIIKNYGHNMTVRHELLVPAILLYMVMVFLLNWAVELEIIKFKKDVVEELVPFLRIDYIVFSTLLLILLLNISSINSYYESHINTLQHIRDYLDQLIFFQRHYFNTGASKVCLFKMQRDLIYEKEPTDPVVKSLLKRLKEFCPPDQYGEYIKECYKAWNLMALNLEKEKSNDKISIMTFKIEGNLVLRFYSLVFLSTLATVKYWIEDLEERKAGASVENTGSGSGSETSESG